MHEGYELAGVYSSQHFPPPERSDAEELNTRDNSDQDFTRMQGHLFTIGRKKRGFFFFFYFFNPALAWTQVS